MTLLDKIQPAMQKCEDLLNPEILSQELMGINEEALYPEDINARLHELNFPVDTMSSELKKICYIIQLKSEYASLNRDKQLREAISYKIASKIIENLENIKSNLEEINIITEYTRLQSEYNALKNGLSQILEIADDDRPVEIVSDDVTTVSGEQSKRAMSFLLPAEDNFDSTFGIVDTKEDPKLEANRLEKFKTYLRELELLTEDFEEGKLNRKQLSQLHEKLYFIKEKVQLEFITKDAIERWTKTLFELARKLDIPEELRKYRKGVAKKSALVEGRALITPDMLDYGIDDYQKHFESVTSMLQDRNSLFASNDKNIDQVMLSAIFNSHDLVKYLEESNKAQGTLDTRIFDDLYTSQYFSTQVRVYLLNLLNLDNVFKNKFIIDKKNIADNSIQEQLITQQQKAIINIYIYAIINDFDGLLTEEVYDVFNIPNTNKNELREVLLNSSIGLFSQIIANYSGTKNDVQERAKLIQIFHQSSSSFTLEQYKEEKRQAEENLQDLTQNLDAAIANLESLYNQYSQRNFFLNDKNIYKEKRLQSIQEGLEALKECKKNVDTNKMINPFAVTLEATGNILAIIDEKLINNDTLLELQKPIEGIINRLLACILRIFSGFSLKSLEDKMDRNIAQNIDGLVKFRFKEANKRSEPSLDETDFESDPDSDFIPSK